MPLIHTTPIVYEPGHGGSLNVPIFGGSSSMPGSNNVPSDNSSDSDLVINDSTSDVDFGDIPGTDQIVDDYSAGASLSQVMKDNPGLSYEEYMKIMASRSDEWAEKLLDYYLEKDSIDEQNRYSAERADTAYQRLVEDLKKAGLNPAMMYGSSASPQVNGSVGHIGLTEGANSRGVSNYNKMRSLLLGIATLAWAQFMDKANIVGTASEGIFDLMKSWFKGYKDMDKFFAGLFL